MKMQRPRSVFRSVVLTCATALGLGAWAAESININFCQVSNPDMRIGTEAVVETPIGTVPGSAWAQSTQNGATSAYTFTGSKLCTITDGTGVTTDLEGSFSVSEYLLQMGNHGYNNSSETMSPVLKSWLGFKNPGDGTAKSSQVVVSGIPFSHYDAIVIMSGYAAESDNTDVSFSMTFGTTFPAVAVNGTTYTYADGATVEGDAAWGERGGDVIEIGKNAFRVNDLSGDLTLAVNVADTGIAGVQIVKAEGYYDANVAEDTAWGDLAWSPALPADVSEAKLIVTVASGKTLTLPATLDVGSLQITGAGTVAFPEGESSIAADSMTIATPVTVPANAVATLESDNATVSGQITNQAGAKLSTKGTVVLSGANQFNHGSVFEVVNGTTTLTAAGQGLQGSVTIDADATLVAGNTDAFRYDATSDKVTALNIYGTLDMRNYRWTMGLYNPITLYTGGLIKGDGDVNAAIDFNKSEGASLTVSKVGNEAIGTATISAPIRSARSGKAAITVNEGMTLVSAGNIKGSYKVVKYGAGTLRIEANPSGYVIPAVYEGVIEFAASGDWNLGAERDLTKYAASGEAVVAIAQTANEYFGGETTFTVTPGAIASVKVNKLDGETTTVTLAVETGVGTLNEEPTVSGKTCWYDFEFNESLTSVGSDTATLSRDTSNGIDNNTSCYTEDKEGIYTVCDAYMSPSYPTEWSASIYAKLPAVQNAVLMAFGTLNGGCIALIGGDTAKNEVLLVRTTGNSKYTKLATMTVPNATTASHLYTFCKSEKKIAIYLDKTLWTTYESESPISFGNGFQIGSLHGGIGNNTGLVQYGRRYYNADDLSANSTIGVLRLYKAMLGQVAVDKLAKEFPYVSPNGSYTLAVSTAESVLSATEAWENAATEEHVDIAANGAAATINASVDSVLTVNADLQTESLTINGNVEFKKDADGHNLQNQGLTSIAGEVKIEYGAVSISGGPTVVASGKIVFDYTNYDGASAIYSTTYVPLTGLMDEAEGKVELIPPTNTYGRTCSLAYYSGAYCMCVVPDHEAGAEVYWDASNNQTYWGDGDTAAKFYLNYENGTFSKETEYYPGDVVVVPDTTQRWYGPLCNGAKIKFDCNGTIDVETTGSLGYVFKNTEVTVAAGTTLNIKASGATQPAVYGGSIIGEGSVAVGDGVTLTMTNGDNWAVLSANVACTGTGKVMFEKDMIIDANTFTLTSGEMFVGTNADDNSPKWVKVYNGGIVNLNGGILNVCRLKAESDMNVNFNGGTLKSYGRGGSWATIIGDTDKTINLKVLTGGAVIDTDSYNTQITSVLATGVTEGKDGGLVKKGAGTLTLTVAPTFTGAISVEAGTLVVPLQDEGARSYTLAEGTEVISSDETTMTLGSFATLTVPVIEGLTATVTVDGAAVEGTDGESVKTYTIRTGKTVVVTYAADDPTKALTGTTTYTVENMTAAQTLVVDAGVADTIATLGGTNYASLEAAIAAANNAQGNYTITLVKSIEIGEGGISINCGRNRNITIEHAEDVKITGAGTITKEGSATLTLKGDMTEYTGIITVNAGTFFVDGGITMNPQQVIVNGGEFKVGAATVNMVNDFENGMDFTLNGTLTMQDGSFLTVGKAPYESAKWLIASANSTINLNGGELAVCRIVKWANVGAATINFNGGTLKSYGAGNSKESIISAEENSPWTLNVLAGGAVVDADIDTTIGGVMASGVTEGTDGGLVKKGAGKLTLAGVPTFTGAVSVEDGALYVPAGTTLNLDEETENVASDVEGFDKYMHKKQGLDVGESEIVEAADAETAKAAVDLAITVPAGVAAAMTEAGAEIGGDTYAGYFEKAAVDNGDGTFTVSPELSPAVVFAATEQEAATDAQAILDAVLDDDATGAMLKSAKPGLYYSLEGSATVGFEKPVEGARTLATSPVVPVAKPKISGGTVFYRVKVSATPAASTND